MKTAWTEFLAPDATTDRGWFKAICEPYDWAKRLEYTEGNTPVFDPDLNQWRESTTLGNYLDYGPCRDVDSDYSKRMYPDGHVHAVCYASHTSRYLRTVAEAKAWIEAEALRVRPELAIQMEMAA